MNARALAFTYIMEIQKLLPSWLELSVNLDFTNESTPLTKHDMFAPVTRPVDQVASIEGCSRLTSLQNGIFSVMRYDKTLSAVIDGIKYNYSENADTGISGDTMCFAVDLCQETAAPVHIQVSQPINNILVSEYLHKFSNRQWNIYFNTVSLFKHPFLNNSPRKFWNGVTMTQIPGIHVDVSVNVETKLQFTDGNLVIGLQFSGDAQLQYEKRLGLLNGEISVLMDSTIGGVKQRFQLSSSDTTAYCHIRDVEDPCLQDGTDISGISFTASYEQQPGEQFFSRLLRFTETTQKCAFQAFFPMNAEYIALGLSLHTSCPLLALDELICPTL